VFWKHIPLNTQYLSVNELQATVNSTDIPDVGTAEVTVSNLPPAGGVANRLPFTRRNHL
jgi:hypothetical protein